MNELEEKLGLIELSPEERLYNAPTASNLKEIPKARQTLEMLIEVCRHDGFALEYASKKLVTFELCEVAVSQNGLALEYVPEKIIEKASDKWIVDLYNTAVKSNGLALQFVPEKYKTVAMAEQAVQYYIYGYSITDEQIKQAHIQGSELSEYRKYPISFIPKTMISESIIKKAVAYSPFCLRDIDSRKITKEIAYLAVKKNALSLKYIPKRLITSELAKVAIETDPTAIKYIPENSVTNELCEKCLKADYTTLAYVPEKYVSESMCLKAIDSRVFSIFDMSSEAKKRNFGDANTKLILFRDFPEQMRNNPKVLDQIIKKYKYGALPLIEWNDDVKKDVEKYGLSGADTDSRGKTIIPLKKETIEYILPKVIEPKDKARLNYTGSVELTPYLRDIKKQTENITLPIQKSTSNENALTIQNESIAVIHELAEEQSSQTIYYITDIHLEHHLLFDERLRKQIKKAKSDIDKKKAIKSWLNNKVLGLVSGTDNRNMLLIGGDVADSIELSGLFYDCLNANWQGKIISVLGNHELWDGTTPEEWNNPDFKSRSIKDIVDDYKKIHDNDIPVDDPEEFLFLKDFMLENELYVLYQNQRPCIVSEKNILDASEATLTEFLSKCSTIILGGIGYSGLNPEFNATCLAGNQTSEGLGLYRKAITSLEEDKRRSAEFRYIYEKVLRCAHGKKMIVLTHTQIENWTSDQPSPNCIYVNGHTHQNTIKRTADGITVLSDNQIGYGLVKDTTSKQTNPKFVYTNPKWKLNSFVIDKLWYDPFENDPDGIYSISTEKYKEFNRGRGIVCEGCSYEGTLYMLKRNGMYMFLFESSRSLCLLSGGRRNKLKNRDVHYYYDNLDVYSKRISNMIKPYQSVMQQLSKEVRMIGGTGTIHGCIIDIDFFNHIYVNPFDGKITSYFAYDICGRKPFNSLKKHIEEEIPRLLPNYLKECEKNSIPLLRKFREDRRQKSELAVLPEWMTGTEIYDPSRIMRAVQYVWEQNVIRIWNDAILYGEDNAGLQGKADIKQISFDK